MHNIKNLSAKLRLLVKTYKPKLNPFSITTYFLFIFSLPFISFILCFFFITYSFLNRRFNNAQFAIDYIIFLCKSSTFGHPDLIYLFTLLAINLLFFLFFYIKFKWLPSIYELRKRKKKAIINAKHTYNEIEFPIIMLLLSFGIILLCFILSIRESYYSFAWCDLVDVYRFASNILKALNGTINYKWENTSYKKENNIIVEKKSPSILESFLNGGYDKIIII